VHFTRATTHFDAFRRDESLGEFAVRMPGQHNVLNALAAIAVADELEVPLDVMKEALATFHGVARRFSVVAEVRGVTLVDDYGHHPAEIAATLQAARNAYDGRILVAFQPHRYSRTELLFDDFTRAFNLADLLLVTDIYAAGEQPIKNVSAERLVQAIARRGHRAVRYVHERNHLVQQLAKRAAPRDVIIALGAGDINKILDQVAAAIGAPSAAPFDFAVSQP
jgi:UDP-N-acetylmuramate--alanine ligase